MSSSFDETLEKPSRILYWILERPCWSRGILVSVADGYMSIPFLPFASAKALTRMSLDLEPFNFRPDRLDAFTNLKRVNTKGEPGHEFCVVK